MNRFNSRQKWTVKIQISKQQCDWARTYGILENLPLCRLQQVLDRPSFNLSNSVPENLLDTRDRHACCSLLNNCSTAQIWIYPARVFTCYTDSDVLQRSYVITGVSTCWPFLTRLSQLWISACMHMLQACTSCCLMLTSSIETTVGSHNPSKSYSCLASSVNKWTTVPSASHVFFQRKINSLQPWEQTYLFCYVLVVTLLSILRPQFSLGHKIFTVCHGKPEVFFTDRTRCSVW